ncbi:MAG: ArsR/SmtB family transcription factor [Alphaproteobacteria bacterium]
MEDMVAVAAFGALAHPRRLKIFKLLDARGCKGLNAGAIAREIQVPPSSLTFHLHLLRQAGLLRSSRHRQQIIYVIDPAQFAQLRRFLKISAQ